MLAKICDCMPITCNGHVHGVRRVGSELILLVRPHVCPVCRTSGRNHKNESVRISQLLVTKLAPVIAPKLHASAPLPANTYACKWQAAERATSRHRNARPRERWRNERVSAVTIGGMQCAFVCYRQKLSTRPPRPIATMSYCAASGMITTHTAMKAR